MPKEILFTQVYALLVTLLLLVCSFSDRRPDKPGRVMRGMILANSALLLCYIFSWLLEGSAKYEALDYLLTFGKCGLGFPLAGLYGEYVFITVSERRSPPRWFMTAFRFLWALAFLLVFVSIFSRMYFSCEGGRYVRGPLYLLNQSLSAAVVAAVAVVVLIYGRPLGLRYMLAMLSYAAFPMLAVAAAVVFPGARFGPLSLATTLSLLIVYITVYVDRGRRLAEKEHELAQSRVSVMLSQIQPHFLYNVLAAIQEMCHGKAPEAEEATREFAEFLRGNLDSLRSGRVIPFEMELRHTKNYLSLEKKRFGSRLNVAYEIRSTAFRLPALTLQPIVENAVRYGVMQREEGGTVRISARETDGGFAVTVADDGVGFDVMEKKSDGRTHIGISNVRDRLETVCGGRLTIESIPGTGTVAEVFVPKEPAVRQKNQNTRRQ